VAIPRSLELLATKLSYFAQNIISSRERIFGADRDAAINIINGAADRFRQMLNGAGCKAALFDVFLNSASKILSFINEGFDEG
jgi:hypothetical protein